MPQLSAKAWFSVDEALQYLAMDPWDPDNEDLLEEWCVDHEVDVEVDEAGNLLEVDPIGLQSVLLALFEKENGYRPDDPKVHGKAVEERLKKERDDKELRRVRKQKLNRRVGQRRAARARAEKAEKAAGNGG